MKRNVLLLIIIFSVGCRHVQGQRIDPVLTSLILENTKKAESMYESQSVAMGVISEGHVLKIQKSRRRRISRSSSMIM